MNNHHSNKKYCGSIYIPELGIQSDVVLIPDEYLFFGLPEIDEEGVEGNEKRYLMICGEFEELGKVTFLDCFFRLYINDRGQMSHAMLFIKMFTGIHLPEHAAKFVTAATWKSGALDEWIRRDIQTTHDLQLVSIETDDLKVRVDWKRRTDSDSGNVLPSSEIEIQFSNSLSLYELGYLNHQLQKLILFLTNEDPELEIRYHNGLKLARIQSFTEFKADWYTDAIEFRFQDIGNRLNELFRSWFEKRKLDNVGNLLLERKYNCDLSKERYFLNMCVALESFHRRFINDKVPLADNSVLKNRERIKKHLQEDPELLNWFNAKSVFWKSPALYDRLIDLKDEYSIIVGDLFHLPIEDLIRNVKKCRDRLAHDGEYETIFQGEIELFLVGYSLEMLLYVLLYKEHGLNTEALIIKLQERAHRNLKRLCIMNEHEKLSFGILRNQT